MDFLTKHFQGLKFPLTFLMPPIFKKPVFFLNSKLELVWSTMWTKYLFFKQRKMCYYAKIYWCLITKAKVFYWYMDTIVEYFIKTSQKSGQSLRNFRGIADMQIMLMYTMWTHLNGRKITVAHYLQVKLLGYQGYSILTLFSREEGKMFTNLTEPEKSQSWRKGKANVKGKQLKGWRKWVAGKSERER